MVGTITGWFRSNKTMEQKAIKLTPEQELINYVIRTKK
jgi:hypothetical protein